MKKSLKLLVLSAACVLLIVGCSNESSIGVSVTPTEDVFEDFEEYDETTTEVNTEDDTEEYTSNEYKSEKDIGDLQIEKSTLPDVPVTEAETTTTEVTTEYQLETVQETTVPQEQQTTEEQSEQFVDNNTGDIDGSNFEMTADMVFLDDVGKLIEDFPLNQLDKIVADISSPIIKKFGRGDYVCEMSNYSKTEDGRVTFIVRAYDTSWDVSIKGNSNSDSYSVTTEEVPTKRD